MTPEPDISSPVSLPAVEKTQRQDSWLGPLFYWEMLREIRKIRSFLPRLLFSLLMLLQVYLVLGGADVTQKQAAYVSERIISYYLFFQYLAVAVLTPIFLAGSVIEERQQGTLALMLTTFLTPGEWLRGKMMGRLFPMLSVLIAGIPILSLMQLFGGVNITGVVVHTVLAAFLMLAVGMYSIYSSVSGQSVGGAVFSVYLNLISGTFLGYLVAWPLSAIFMLSTQMNSLWMVAILVLSIILMHLLLSWSSFRKAVELLEKRNADYDVTKSPSEQLDFDARLKSLETEMINTIRKPEKLTPLQQKELEAREEVQKHVKESNRKLAVYAMFPMVWKGTFFPPSSALWVWTILVVVLNLTIIFVFIMTATRKSIADFALHLSGFMQWTPTLVMVLVIFRASSVIVAERKEKTWIALMILPWSTARLVFEFAAGVLWRYRGLLSVSIVSILAHGLSFKMDAVLAVLIAYLIQLVFFCVVGLLISTISRTLFFSRVLSTLFLLFFLLYLPGNTRNHHRYQLSLLQPAPTWLSSEANMNQAGFASDVLTALIPQGFLIVVCFAAVCLLIKQKPDR